MLTKIEILNSFARNLNSLKIFKEIVIFRKFYTVSRLSEIWTKYEIIENFEKKNRDDVRNVDKNRDFQNCGQNQDFSKMLTIVEISKIFSETDIFENFDQN